MNYLLFTLLYLHAGLVISWISMEYIDETIPTYFFNEHKSLKASWDLNTTKLIFKTVIVLFWIFLPFMSNNKKFI